jgi:pimeloyl-ACP methyl ester carboxylesterase
MGPMDVFDAGTGPAILLIHGFPLDRRVWEAQIGGLSARGRIVAPDLPGCGRSPLSPAPASIDDYARALLSLMDARGLARFAVAGHSMGGYIIFALHRLAPDRLTGAAFVSSRAMPDTEAGRKTREETAQRALREGPGFLADSMPAKAAADGAPPALLERLRAIMKDANGPGVAAAARAMAGRPDAVPQLARIACPAVVFAGRLDKIVPPAESEAMAQGIPGARLVWCEKSGHVPMMEEPDLVTRELSALLARI